MQEIEQDISCIEAGGLLSLRNEVLGSFYIEANRCGLAFEDSEPESELQC